MSEMAAFVQRTTAAFKYSVQPGSMLGDASHRWSGAIEEYEVDGVTQWASVLECAASWKGRVGGLWRSTPDLATTLLGNDWWSYFLSTAVQSD